MGVELTSWSPVPQPYDFTNLLKKVVYGCDRSAVLLTTFKGQGVAGVCRILAETVTKMSTTKNMIIILPLRRAYLSASIIASSDVQTK